MSPLHVRIVSGLIPDPTLRRQIRDILFGGNKWEIKEIKKETDYAELAEHFKLRSLHDYVHAYAKIGELLEIVKPYKCIGAQKQRIGSGHDGGYVMLPPDSGDIAYSFGVSDYSPWDLTMAENGHQVFQYDGTIEAAPNSHPNMHFHRNNIASPSQNTPDTKTIGQIFDDLGHQGKDNIILQIDIEGAEWTVFEEISEEQIKQFKQIIIEWHHLSPFLDGFDRRLEILRKVAKTHTPIHVHANNYGYPQTAKQGLPFYGDAYEITYVRTADFEFEPDKAVYPTALDAPCNPNWPEISIGAW